MRYLPPVVDKVKAKPEITAHYRLHIASSSSCIFGGLSAFLCHHMFDKLMNDANKLLKCPSGW